LSLPRIQNTDKWINRSFMVFADEAANREDLSSD
jgi:hypothetical protein